jgi:hypothetical protein
VRVLVEGKEAVLAYLENQLLDLTGHPGRYSLAVDDRGQLVICIAGNMFIGEGESIQAGMRLVVRGGVVKHLKLPGPAPDGEVSR